MAEVPPTARQLLLCRLNGVERSMHHRVDTLFDRRCMLQMAMRWNVLCNRVQNVVKLVHLGSNERLL